jgi:hypothetical protein
MVTAITGIAVRTPGPALYPPAPIGESLCPKLPAYPAYAGTARHSRLQKRGSDRVYSTYGVFAATVGPRPQPGLTKSVLYTSIPACPSGNLAQ